MSSKARARVIGGPLSTTPVTTTDWTTSPILDTTEAIKQGEGQDVEAHPFALGALGEPAMERFRRAQLPFAAVAFGRFDGGRRDPAGGPRTKRKPKRRLLIRKWYRPCADMPGNASWLSANGTPDPFPNVRGGRKWHSLDLCLDLERDHQSPCQYVIAGALLMSIL